MQHTLLLNGFYDIWWQRNSKWDLIRNYTIIDDWLVCNEGPSRNYTIIDDWLVCNEGPSGNYTIIDDWLMCNAGPSRNYTIIDDWLVCNEGSSRNYSDPGLSVEAGSRRKSAVYGGFKCRLLHWQNINSKRKKISFSNVYLQLRDVLSQSRAHNKLGMKSQCLPWAKYRSHEFRSLIGCLFKVKMHRFFSKITREKSRWSLKDNNRDVPMVINSLAFFGF